MSSKHLVSLFQAGAADTMGDALGQMKSLHTQFASQWQTTLSTLLPGYLQVRFVDAHVMDYSDWVRSQSEHVDATVFEIDAMQTMGAWITDRQLVSAVVERMFGGTLGLPVRDPFRPMTPMEIGVHRRIWEALATAYESVWQSVYPLRLKSFREEHLIEDLRLVGEPTSVLVATHQIDVAGHKYPLHWCAPWHPLQSALQTVPATDDPPAGQAWSRSLQHQLQSTPLDAVAVLAQKQLSVEQLTTLAIGQVIDIDINPEIAVVVDGATLFKGEYGIHNGRYAIKVTQASDVITPETPTAASDAQMADQWGSVDEALRSFDEQINDIGEQ